MRTSVRRIISCAQLSKNAGFSRLWLTEPVRIVAADRPARRQFVVCGHRSDVAPLDELRRGTGEGDLVGGRDVVEVRVTSRVTSIKLSKRRHMPISTPAARTELRARHTETAAYDVNRFRPAASARTSAARDRAGPTCSRESRMSPPADGSASDRQDWRRER